MDNLPKREPSATSIERTKMKTKCSEVEHPFWEDTADIFLRKELLHSGVQLWDFHGCEGHVLTEEIVCSRDSGHYCGMCGHRVAPHKYWTCECGDIWPGDWHHYRIMLISVEELLQARP